MKKLKKKESKSERSDRKDLRENSVKLKESNQGADGQNTQRG